MDPRYVYFDEVQTITEADVERYRRAIAQRLAERYRAEEEEYYREMEAEYYRSMLDDEWARTAPETPLPPEGDDGLAF